MLGGLGTVVGSWLAYPTDPWASEALKKPLPYDPARSQGAARRGRLPEGFDLTMNLTAWPGRGYLPDVGEAVATYWEKIGIRASSAARWTARCSADFGPAPIRRDAGVCLAARGPETLGGRSSARGHTKAAVSLFMDTPSWTSSWTGWPRA